MAVVAVALMADLPELVEHKLPEEQEELHAADVLIHHSQELQVLSEQVELAEAWVAITRLRIIQAVPEE
jgi:hypothetical protein